MGNDKKEDRKDAHKKDPGFSNVLKTMLETAPATSVSFYDAVFIVNVNNHVVSVVDQPDAYLRKLNVLMDAFRDQGVPIVSILSFVDDSPVEDVQENDFNLALETMIAPAYDHVDTIILKPDGMKDVQVMVEKVIENIKTQNVTKDFENDQLRVLLIGSDILLPAIALSACDVEVSICEDLHIFYSKKLRKAEERMIGFHSNGVYFTDSFSVLNGLYQNKNEDSFS